MFAFYSPQLDSRVRSGLSQLVFTESSCKRSVKFGFQPELPTADFRLEPPAADSEARLRRSILEGVEYVRNPLCFVISFKIHKPRAGMSLAAH